MYTRRPTVSLRTYVRGSVPSAGRQTICCGPARNRFVVLQIVFVARPGCSVSVRRTSSRTFAARSSRKLTIARSRNPSPFGETVVSSRLSPANGREPFVTFSACRFPPERSAASPNARKLIG